MIRVLFALTFWKACRCPPGMYAAEGVRPTGETVCSSVPPLWCGDPGTMRACPDGFRFPLRIVCPRGTAPRVDYDGRGTSCRRVGIAVPDREDRAHVETQSLPGDPTTVE